jgi:hypothetical protein
MGHAAPKKLEANRRTPPRKDFQATVAQQQK